MRSFLSIISKRAEYSDIKLIFEAVGFENTAHTGVSLIGYSPSSAYLKFDHRADGSDFSPCFMDTERYFIQYDIRVFSEVSGRNSLNQLFNQKVLESLFKDPSQVNSLPIRDFHLLIWDKIEARFLAFRDQIGIWPLYYYSDENWLLVSTDLILLRSLKMIDLSAREQWIAELLVNLHSDGEEIFYNNIRLVKPGHVLLSDHVNESTESYYDLGQVNEIGHYDLKEAKEILKFKLVAAIENRLKGFQSVGSELSGGLDSSSVVSLAYTVARNTGMEFHSFSNVLPKEEKSSKHRIKDESYYSSLLVNDMGIRNHHTLHGKGKGILNELRLHLKTMGMPTQQLFTLFSDEVYENVSKLDIPLLLSGFGGDEGISYNGSGFYEEMAYKRNWDILLRELKLNYKREGKFLIRGRTRYLVMRYVPFGSDLLSELKKRKHWKRKKIKGFGYDDDFGQRMKILPRYLKEKGYSSEKLIMERQSRRLTHSYLSSRLIGSYQASLIHEFSYSFPLLDRDLLEFHLALPAEYKYRNGIGRMLLREAMKGNIPEAIRLRNDKQGAVVPNIYFRLLKDENAVRQLIKHSQERNKYHYLDYKKLLIWLEKLIRNDPGERDYHNPNAFYNSLQILLLQEMERSGEFKTGIYC